MTTTRLWSVIWRSNLRFYTHQASPVFAIATGFLVSTELAKSAETSFVDL